MSGSETKNGSNKTSTPEVKNQMPHDGVRINLAMEIPSKPDKPNTPINPPADKN